jgi:hypothetical protein
MKTKMKEVKFMSYYKVLAKCGHVGGRRFYIPIEFFVAANSAKQAAEITRNIPRVKHDQKDAILWVECISYDEYLEGREKLNNDPYITSSNPFEQSFYHNEIMERVLEETAVYLPWVNKYKDRDIDVEERPNHKRAAKFGHNKKMQGKFRENFALAS